MKKKLYISLFILLFGAAACGQADDPRLDAITQQLAVLQDEQSTLTARLDFMEAQATMAAAEPTPLPATPTPAGPPDYLAYRHLIDLLEYLPLEYTHPFSQDMILKAVFVQQQDRVRIGLVYDQVITTPVLEEFAAGVGGELTEDTNTLSGSPGWFIDKEGVNYNIQLLEPGQWYSGYLETDTAATIVFINYPLVNAPDLSDLFEDNLFRFDDYLMPETLVTEPDEKMVVIERPNEAQEEQLVSVMRWKGIDRTQAEAIYAHYLETLAGHEWFDPNQGDIKLSVYARLDEARSISVNVQYVENGSVTLEIAVAHF